MHCPEIRVVALTMYSSFRLAAMTVGADAFLVKGCSTEELLTAIGTLPPTPAPSDS
ncbi:MAG TPA: hypothetical protein VHS28_04055 [Chloroflexota bacterium]|nr:hypothetical protein [Chloroflexota bacterium]